MVRLTWSLLRNHWVFLSHFSAKQTSALQVRGGWVLNASSTELLNRVTLGPPSADAHRAQEDCQNTPTITQLHLCINHSPVQWNLTLNLSNGGTVCSPNHIELCTNLPMNQGHLSIQDNQCWVPVLSSTERFHFISSLLGLSRWYLTMYMSTTYIYTTICR